MSEFGDLTDYARIVFDENEGKINIDQFNSILKAFDGELIRFSAKKIEREYRSEFIKKLKKQGLSNSLICDRLVMTYGVSLSRAWQLVGAKNEDS